MDKYKDKDLKILLLLLGISPDQIIDIYNEINAIISIKTIHYTVLNSPPEFKSRLIELMVTTESQNINSEKVKALGISSDVVIKSVAQAQQAVVTEFIEKYMSTLSEEKREEVRNNISKIFPESITQ